jgi:hypothetical protein
MVVETPEVLHCVEVDDWALVVLPGPGPVVLEEPQSPRILQIKVTTHLIYGTFS